MRNRLWNIATTNRAGVRAALPQRGRPAGRAAAAWPNRFVVLLMYRRDLFTRRIRDLATLTENSTPR